MNSVCVLPRVPGLYTSTLCFIDNNTQPEGETKKSFNSAFEKEKVKEQG